nr:uncharacterized protein LOC111421598 [Onthophagus taurus]
MEIEEAHNKLEEFDAPTHAYFTTNYITQLKKLYQEVMNQLAEIPRDQTEQSPGEDREEEEILPSSKEENEDIEQAQRIKRQEVRIEKLMKLHAKIENELKLRKPKSTYDYLKKQIQEQMDNIQRLEEDIQVFETKFKSKYFKEEKFLNCEEIFHSVMEQLQKITSEPYESLLDKILDFPKLSIESSEKIKELHDTTSECLQAISNIGIVTEPWGPMISRILVRKWDNETNKLYEQSLKDPNKIQEFQELMEFLQTRFQSLEAIGEKTKRHQVPTQQTKYEQNKTCRYCGGDHYIHSCSKFQELPGKKMEEFVNTKNLCRNCLSHKFTGTCNSTKRCLKCKKPHHTLLRRDEKKIPSPSTKITAHVSQTNEEQTNINISSNHASENRDTVLLATALVKARSASGTMQYLRILVDQGGQASFITESAAHLLSYPREKVRAEISGLGDGSPKTSKWKIQFPIQPHYPSNFSMPTTFLVLPKLTQSLPSKKLPEQNSQEIINKILADPTYNIPGPIDAIIGAQEYGNILEEGLQKTTDGLLGQKTKLGWILSGHLKQQCPSATKVTCFVSRVEEEKQLIRFWEIEEVEQPKQKSEDEQDCEKYYHQTTKRNKDGTYTVKIPFKTKVVLGCSKSRATARLFQLENRLVKNDELKSQYDKFITEYIELSHMEKISEEDSPGKYYIPHQAVLRPSSTTTKLRVVFDASCKSSNGKSRNDFMHTGPRLQQEIADILLRWRTHKIVFSADVEKMYRQIRMAEEDQQYQRILWRFNKHSPIEEYKLTTVTYGTTAAPYIAVQTLQQLARDEEDNYSKASQVALRDVYVDDVLSGADSIQEACDIQQQLIEMLKAGGFTLRKWVSNREELLSSLSNELKEQNEKEITEDWPTKSLGVYWAPQSDTFRFKVNTTRHDAPSKRMILSEIAKLYDPLG